MAERRKRRDLRARVRCAGVRAFIVPVPRDVSGGVAGSKTVAREGRQEAGCGKDGEKQWQSRQCLRGLNKGQRQPAGNRGLIIGGLKLRSGRIAWCRRWSTASKAANGSV